MKTTMIYLVVLLMVASTAFAQKTGFIDDVYFKPSDARNIEIKANERQRPVVKNGARQIVFVDASNTDVIVTKDTVYVLGNESKKAYADSLSFNEEEGEYINGFRGSESDLEYAERIRRFHNPKYTIHISNPAWNDLYFLDSWDWNVYVDGTYAWVTPTWTNSLWFDYHYRPYSYNRWNSWNSWHSPYYGGWGGYGWGGWNSWSHGYHSGYYAGYYGWPYGYGGGYGGYYGYGNYWNSWGGSNWGGSNYVTNNNRGRATDYNYTGTRQSTVNSGGGSAGVPAYGRTSGTRSSYSAVGSSTQTGTRTVSTGTRSISTNDRSQSVAPGITRSYSSDRSVDGRSYSTQGTRSGSAASNNTSTRNSSFDNRTASGSAATASGSRSTTTTSPSSRSYSTAPASTRSYSTTPSSTRSSSTYSAPSSTRSSSSYSTPSSTRSSSSSSSSSYRSSSSSSSSSSVSPSRSSSSSSSYSGGSSGGSSSSGGSRSSSSSSSSSGTRR